MRVSPTGKRKSPPPPPRRVPDPTAAARADLLRRFLLGLVTALLVARPLVVGEDPGLLASISHPSSLIITVFWLLAAVGWAAWQYWSGQTWRGGVEVGLLATVGFVVLSAAVAARYKHPAWLICWEWFVLLVAFCLVRQLARAPGDNRGLLAALLATGVTLSVYAVFQYTVEFPRAREALREPGLLRQELAQQESVFLEDESEIHLPEDGAALLGTAAHAGFPASLPWGPLLLAQQPNAAEPDLRLARWEERIQAANVFATYAHPNSFAGFLALLLPAAFGLAWVSGTGAVNTFRYGPLLAALCALLLAVALWFTHSRGAILGVLVAAAALGLTLGGSFVRRHKVPLAVGAVVLVGLGWWVWQSGWLGTALGKGTQTSARRLEYWGITGAMIADRPWLGVGPGNFGRVYPHYMPASAFEKLQDPHNFVLEMWATSGVFAALALLATLALFFWRVWQSRARTEQEADAEDSPEAFAKLRWEFYLGGVAGLLLGFVLRAGNLSPDFILMEGILAGVRSIIWFLAFAILDSILWTGVARPLVLAAGVLALLVNLCVSGGIALPSVAQPLWIMAALALNAASPDGEPPRPAGNWLWRFVSIPALAVVWLAYMLLTYGPVTNAADAVQQARRHYLEWRDVHEPYWRIRFLESKDREHRLRYSNRANEFLETRIIKPLERATREDPGNAAQAIELSHWYGERWKLFASDKKLDGADLQQVDRAGALDPENKQSYLAKVRLRRLFAATMLERGLPARIPEQHGLAARALEEVLKRDPNDARLRFQYAEALFQFGETVKGREAAAAALELDGKATEAGRRLTDRQRRQAQRWTRPAGEK